MRRLECPKQYQATFILSGPEPQRTLFENIILKQLKNLKQNFCLIRGVVSEENANLNTNDNIEVHNYLTSNDLNQKIAASHFVICRSGYSSIMDLWAAGAQAVLIPTPGQTEQIYLADYLCEQNLFYKQTQTSLNLAEAISSMNDVHLQATSQATEGCLPYSTSCLKQNIHRLLTVCAN
jgi:UDP-N-acetylglucosamine:LPS N-acetylglucosamine transferase